MRKRLVTAAACILALPLLFSPSQSDLTNQSSFATVAFAGRTLAGGWCDCPAPGCTCDPGEVGGNSRPLPNQTEKPSHQNASPIRERTGFDFGTGALMLALAFFVWTRLRA